MQRPKLALMFVTYMAVIAVLLLLGCGGGGGNNNPTPQKSPTPDGTTIQAVVDPSQFLLITSGAAFEPGATVHIFDANLAHVSTTADASGAINISNWDFPTGFVKTAGTSVTITQVATGKTESEAITVTIQDITQI